MKKISVDSLVIETTRKCNLKCRHCLRGGIQRINLKKEYLENTLKQINYINSVTFSGGEPSLNSQAILDFLELVRKYKIPVNYFYIATNGKKITEQFFLAINKMYFYCEDKELCLVEITKDKFHKEFGNFELGILENLNFVSIRDYDSSFERQWIYEGRYKKNFDFHNAKITYIDTFIYEGECFQDGNIYLNCKGNLIAGCNFSYISQNKKENIICQSSESIYDNIQKFVEE